MKCPKCHNAMRTYNRSGVQIEQCDGCRGIFLDYGELEALTQLEGQWQQQAAPPPPPAPPAAPYGGQYGGPYAQPAWGVPPHGGHHGHHHGHQGGFARMLFST